jgi:hypothetical protein
VVLGVDGVGELFLGGRDVFIIGLSCFSPITYVLKKTDFDSDMGWTMGIKKKYHEAEDDKMLGVYDPQSKMIYLCSKYLGHDVVDREVRLYGRSDEGMDFWKLPRDSLNAHHLIRIVQEEVIKPEDTLEIDTQLEFVKFVDMMFMNEEKPEENELKILEYYKDTPKVSYNLQFQQLNGSNLVEIKMDKADFP